MNKWYRENGRQKDVISGTQIRLSRSLPGYPYPRRMNAAGRLQVEKLVCAAAMSANSVTARRFAYLRLEEAEKVECLSLAERKMIPEIFAKEHSGGLIYLPDESVCITINDGDHLRMTVRCAGYDPEGAYAIADRLDSVLDRGLHFAFDPELGYLTQDPAELGTGMHASLELHLPALRESGSIGRVASGLAKLGLRLEEDGGGGTLKEGDSPVYCLSNCVTLGLSERQALENLSGIAAQLITQEQAARELLAEKLEVQDAVSRAVGVLQSARMLPYAELAELIGRVRFGIAAGLVEGPCYEQVDSLLIEMRPQTLQAASGRRLSKAERDSLRAELVRAELFAHQ